MLDLIETFAQRSGLPEQSILIAGLGLGVLMVILGIGALAGERSPAADRIAAIRTERHVSRANRGLLHVQASDPAGIWKAVLPTNLKERADLTRKLARAGLTGPHTLLRFTMVRIALGLVLPAALAGLVILSRQPGVALPFGLSDRLAGLSNLRLFQLVVILVAVGYWAPAKWLNDRAGARQRQIEEAFPNALDLMQVSVEAGLGFDAAMTRVGNELIGISPAIAFEFLTVQRQVQAGRPRDQAMHDMALRSGVDTVRSFANVVSQSMQFGTSMSEALRAYAKEMREVRELRAQEAANKLPVKMSGVLATLMLPALIGLTVGPVVIRYIRFFGS
ncbi:type II secretion system F family protein [Wenxinia marina]|uniref:Flp pilus assembly protein TadC n=1 Tax=Wenxinia marina DSM 24838 TaxID=1123501 RepID=A0A0D0Q4G2_9RHOB|nr:type II secretion system F family protein [Wenxinia marina]KIQ69424.1 Flp pilus assembly protein TadC [Wenxinia marina DSM 24838]GGL58216.1 hypothetical protein GCM10011392_10830 [Wenxinia marina]